MYSSLEFMKSSKQKEFDIDVHDTNVNALKSIIQDKAKTEVQRLLKKKTSQLEFSNSGKSLNENQSNRNLIDAVERDADAPSVMKSVKDDDTFDDEVNFSIDPDCQKSYDPDLP